MHKNVCIIDELQMTLFMNSFIYGNVPLEPTQQLTLKKSLVTDKTALWITPISCNLTNNVKINVTSLWVCSTGRVRSSFYSHLWSVVVSQIIMVGQQNIKNALILPDRCIRILFQSCWFVPVGEVELI